MTGTSTRSPLPKAMIVCGVLLVSIGASIAWFWPSGPLLVFWMASLIGMGSWVSLTTAITGMRQRTETILILGGVAAFAGLLTTQLAARRDVSAMHVRYRGVLVERSATVRIGTAAAETDVTLATAPEQLFPWMIRVTRDGARWKIEAERNVDQLRLSTAGDRRRPLGEQDVRWELGGAARLQKPGDEVTVLNEQGTVVDTLTLRGEGTSRRLASRRSGEFLLSPVEERRSSTYQKLLATGAPLSAFDGVSRRSAPFERFVRLREERLESDAPWWDHAAIRMGLKTTDLLLTAATPFRLQGATVQSVPLSFGDSAEVEVKQGGYVWRFHLMEWRRTASSGRGLALLFGRLPRPLNNPITVGNNCESGAACAVLSIRPLPAPISYLSLGSGGFSATRFGLFGRLVEREDGYDVVLPRDTAHVRIDDERPTAIPVQAFDTSGSVPVASANTPSRYWVLLSASTGIAEGLATLVAIAVGIALLVWAFYRVIAAVPFRIATLPLDQQRTIGLAMTALLALLLARTIVGARVTFFEPFNDRGIETMIGMWIAVTTVSGGLLTWRYWVPQAIGVISRLEVREIARTLRSLRRLRQALARAMSYVQARSSKALFTFAISVVALVVLALAAGGVLEAVAAAGLVLAAWFCVASVVAIMSPSPLHIDRASDAVAVLGHNATPWRSEGMLVGTCAAAALLLWKPVFAVLLGVIGLVIVTVLSGRKFAAHRTLAKAGIGPFVFLCATAFAKSRGSNGSMPILTLVVLVTLVSIRIGRVAESLMSISAIESASQLSGVDRKKSPSPLWLGVIISSGLLLLLLPLTALDMGLFLVMLVPIAVAVFLAYDAFQLRRWQAWIVPMVFGIPMLYLLGSKVLSPPLDDIRRAPTHDAKAVAFDQMGRVWGFEPPFIGESLSRAAARGIATADKDLAEELLLSAAPGQPLNLLKPSIEQIWGAAAYSSAGATGAGLGRAVVGDRGVAAAVSYAENSYAVYILAEHGALGGIVILLAYLLLTGAVGYLLMLSAGNNGPAMRSIRALLLVAVLIIVVPAVYVALSNIGVLPITGQNMPFLGLNAWSDVAICAGAIGMLITSAIHNAEGVV